MPLAHMADVVLAGLGGSVSVKWASEALAGFAHVAAPAAVAALWQSGVVALALVLCLQFVLRVSAAYRFAAWATGFAVAALLPLLPLLENSGAGFAAAPTAGAAARPWLALDSRWGFAIAALWLAASTFRAAELVFHSLRLRRLWRGATPVEAEPSLRSLLAAALPARRIQICTTPDLDRPSVIGFFAPRILIPDWLYPRLTPDELKQVVLHEAEHLRRRDDWTNLLQKLSLVLFPLNPALAWMERRLCREREMACDEGVVQRTQAPRIYAACLATLAERGLQRRELWRRAQTLSLGAFERRPELIHRVHSILRRKRGLHPLAASTLVGVVGCGLVIGAVELSRSPQLVAFVALPKSDAQTAVLAPPETGTPAGVRGFYARTNKPSPAADEAGFHPSGRYRAIETKATVSLDHGATAAPAARLRRSDGSSAGVTDIAMMDRAATRRHIWINTATLTPAPAIPQEFVVLTAWEEVQTSAPQTSAPQTFATSVRTVADYEILPNAQKQRDIASTQPNAIADAQITFTRLIVFVYPANAATGHPASAAASAQSTQVTGSHSHRPTASFDGGWLIFKL